MKPFNPTIKKVTFSKRCSLCPLDIFYLRQTLTLNNHHWGTLIGFVHSRQSSISIRTQSQWHQGFLNCLPSWPYVASLQCSNECWHGRWFSIFLNVKIQFYQVLQAELKIGSIEMFRVREETNSFWPVTFFCGKSIFIEILDPGGVRSKPFDKILSKLFLILFFHFVIETLGKYHYYF